MSAGLVASEQLEQCVRTACSELGKRLREGDACRAEDYFSRIPELGQHSELALELIYTEYVVREELGCQYPSEDWFRRFPQWTNDLHQLLEVHRQLCETETVQATGSKWQSISLAGSTAHSTDESRHGAPPANRTTAGPASTGPAMANLPDGGRRGAETVPGEIGRVIGNYQLLEEIGRGGMGVVYRARQLNLQRDVALKMILSGEFASPREMVRFQAEAHSTAKLQHPNIVQIYEVGAHQQCPYLSMELIKGGNLDSRLKAGLPAPREAASLLLTVARAVHFAHQSGVIHRDLKPCNVLLDDHGNPKVADFGLAKQLMEGRQDCSRSGGLVGTLQYMAPESIGSSDQTVSAATDVYSLGIILYEMLTGQTPFSADTQLETLRQITTQEPALPTALSSSARARIPRDLETICLKCLQKDPRRRYASAADLAD
ncbi:MAG: serine/threonine protein kinase, partial [Pirellulaceae bacterium]|nr:serine/threonine protein kinase [Pirellulaceae bacterium]